MLKHTQKENFKRQTPTKSMQNQKPSSLRVSSHRLGHPAETNPTPPNSNKRLAEPEADLPCGYLPTALNAIIKHSRSHQTPMNAMPKNRSLQIPMNATLNQKKSLQTTRTTLPRQPQIPSALGPSHQPSMNHCTFSLLPTRPPSNRELRTYQHRAQACPAHHTQTDAPTSSYKAASLLAVISANLTPLRFPPRGNHSVETKARLAEASHLPNRADPHWEQPRTAP